MKLSQFLPVPVSVPIKVRVSRSPRNCGVLIPHPKWEKSPSLFSCVVHLAQIDVKGSETQITELLLIRVSIPIKEEITL